jgi:hypothetical protein
MANKKISKVNLSGESYEIDVAKNLKATNILSTDKDQTSKVATVGAVQKPDGVNAFFDENNKINSSYLSDTILGQLKFGGTLTSYNPSNEYTVNPSQLILSKLYELTNYPEGAAPIDSLQLSIVGDPSIVSITMISNGEVKNGYGDNDGTAFEGFYFISAANLSDEYAVGDWLVINNKNFEKIDNTDTITHIKDADTSLLSIEGAGLKLDKITKNNQQQVVIEGEALVGTPSGDNKDAIVNVDYLEAHTISELYDTGVKLSEDLYAYADIGKITGASNIKPVKVASQNDTLKDVFNKVFGEQTDQDPSISGASYSLSKSQGTTSVGGEEYGSTVAPATAEITFTLNTSGGTAPYGYKYTNAAGETVTVTDSSSFYYPISKQSNGDIKITLPANKTATVVSGYGEIKATGKTSGSTTDNILYCNFNSSKKVKLQISLEGDTVELTSQERYGAINASVEFGPAQADNSLTASSPIINFLTFLGEECTDNASVTSHLSKANATTSSTAYTINKGYKYNYYAVTSSDSAPTSANDTGVVSLGTSSEKNPINTEDNTYIWFIMATQPTEGKIQQYAMSQWNNVNTSPDTATKAQIEFTTSTGKTLTYYAYRTDKMTKASGQYKII